MGDGGVSVDSAVTEEWPVLALDFDFSEVNRNDEDFFFSFGSTGEDLARGVGYEALAPELDAVAISGWDFFETDAVGGGDEAAIGDGMGALDGFPGVVLAFAELEFFSGVPADGSWVEENLSAGEGG